MRLRVCLLIIATSLLVACSSSPNSAYPGERPYPGIRVGAPNPTIIPTPAKGSGTLTGKLENSASNQSLGGLIIYLGTILPLNQGEAHLVTISSDQSPKTTVQPDGTFVFSNVAPARYAIVLWSPFRSSSVLDPQDPQKEFIVTVEPDKVTDLGTIEASPP